MAKVVHIGNPTAVEFTNVNAGGTDIPPYSVVRDVTLTDAEAGTLIDTQKAILIKATATDEELRLACKILKLGRNPGSSTAGQ